MPKNAPALPPEVIRQLLDNQSQELQIRAAELALTKQLDDHGFQFGIKALEAQSQDRDGQRKHKRKVQIGTYVLVGFIVLLIISVIIAAMYLNKDTIAVEIIKAVCYSATGGLGGYGLHRIKSPPIKEYDANTTSNR